MADITAECVLGLDIGANSIGWAIIEYEGGHPVRLRDLGVRVFEAGVEGEIEQGKDQSRAAARRQARLMRRQLDRRARRNKKLALLLQEHGLLPEGDLGDETVRDAVIKTLDLTLHNRYAADCPQDSAQSAGLDQLPYFLRARALDGPLEPFELGRALYHLAQRRGFQSNRIAPKKKDEDRGKVESGISELNAAMEAAGARTLGEYFAQINPHERRIRSRWTSRQMYQNEFDAIWSAQERHHPERLSEDFHDELYEAIFFQRPLRSQKGLVGRCELEKGHRRAPWASREAQRFRMLQRVNDLRIVAPDYTERGLTREERAAVLDKLDHSRETKFTELRRLLKLPKGSTFNLERGGEDRLVGNRVAAEMRKVFGDRWNQMPPEEQDRAIDDVRSIQNDDALTRRAMRVWGLDEEAARTMAKVELEEGYCALSRVALRRLLPLMEDGGQYAAVRKSVYGDRGGAFVTEALPYVDDKDNIPFELRNPAVHRALTELRKIVNAVIDKYGKPDRIRIELARDLKRSREDRKQTWKKNRENQRKREAAAKRIMQEMGIQNPKREDILRVTLAEECEWRCPYTGRSISMGNLLGDASQFDIEHIIPYSRCLDDSYMNKTLCYHEVNRTRKQNRTPYEAFGNDPEWQAILERVKRFKGGPEVVRAKLRRFTATSLDDYEEYAARQLNDTRYASTLAARYLALLYGGLKDAGGVQRIQAGRGEITADLRRAWNLNRILGDGDIKTRDDHRHHAIDAIAIALTDAKTVKALSEANEKAGREGRRAWWKNVPAPWSGFLEDVQAAVERIVVSHRPSRKVGGPLHEETYYSRQRVDANGKPYVHVRKAVDALSVSEVEAIVDPVVRDRVKARLEELGGGDPSKQFQAPENHPWLETRDGRRIPIHRVRIRKNISPFSIGRGPRERHVVAKENHHMEILETTDKKGNVKWEGLIVDQFTALQRVKKCEPVVKRDHGAEKRFVMSLAGGDTIQFDAQGSRGTYVVRTISGNNIEMVRINDARKKKDIKASGDWLKRSVNALREANVCRIQVTPLGEVRRAND